MKIKTNELTGAALDWAVAKAMGLEPKIHYTGIYARNWPRSGCRECPQRIEPSTNWAQGGPIMDREHISPREERKGLFFAPYFNGVCYVGHQEGPTMLIAAMRCYVAKTLGKEVDIPEELL